MNVINNEKNKFVWKVNLGNYPLKTEFKVGYNCTALCIKNGQLDRTYGEGEVIQINRRFGKTAIIIAASCESFDIPWGCFGVNPSDSRSPEFTLGMNGLASVKLDNLDIFYREFSDLLIKEKPEAVEAIVRKLLDSLNAAAKEALGWVAKRTGGREPDLTLLKEETEDKFKEIVPRWGMELVSLTVNGIQRHAEEPAEGTSGGVKDRVDKILGTGEYASEEDRLNNRRRELEKQHVCPVCGNIYQGQKTKCPACGADLT